MRARLTVMACVRTMAVVSVLTGCDATAPTRDAIPLSSSAPACAEARTAVGPVYRAEVLTAVAPVETVTARAGGRLTAVLHPVRRYRAEVVADGDVPQADVFRGFVERLGDEVTPQPLGETAPAEADPSTVKVPGRFVRYTGVLAVQATFA